MSYGAEVVFDGVLFERPDAWDVYPSHLFINGRHHIWYCGKETLSTIDKVFADNSIHVGQSSTLSITVTNTAPHVLSGVGFSDVLPSGAGELAFVAASLVNSCGGSAVISTTSAPDDTLTLSGGSVATLGTCSVSVDVLGLVVGTYTNTTSPVVFDHVMGTDIASDVLQVVPVRNVAEAPFIWIHPAGGEISELSSNEQRSAVANSRSNLDAIFHVFKDGQLSPGGWSTPVEVFNHDGSAWATANVCDPSVIRGDFTIGSQSYQYAMYYTADRASGGTNGGIGVAFWSQDTQWAGYGDTPIIVPDGPLPSWSPYGAGESAVAYDRSGLIHHLQLDTYYDLQWSAPDSIRLRYTTDGLVFTPTPSIVTQLGLADPEANRVGSPDMAYSPLDSHWYAVTSTVSWTADSVTTFVLWAEEVDSLLGSWRVVATLDEALSGYPWNIEPGLARNADTTLYVDEEGWAHVVFGAVLRRPATGTWDMSQARVRVTSPAFARDSFTNFIPGRAMGEPLAGTATEQASRVWETNWPELVLGDNELVVSASVPGASFVGAVPYDSPANKASVEARINPGPSDAGWTAIGFLGQSPEVQPAGFPYHGRVWMLVNPDDGHVEVWAGNTTTGQTLFVGGPVPNWAAGEYNAVKIEHDSSSSTVRGWVNGVLLGTWQLSLAPLDFHYAGLQMYDPVVGETKIDGFAVNLSEAVFADDFESGDTAAWWIVQH